MVFFSSVISCFLNLTFGDRTWPFASTKTTWVDHTVRIRSLTAAHEVFTLGLLLTSNDLWPLQKIDLLNAKWGHPHANCETNHDYPAWYIVFTRFYRTAAFDSRWTLTSTKYIRFLVMGMGHPHAKYEARQWFPSLNVMYTSYVLGLRSFTAVALRWPSNSTKRNRILKLTVTYRQSNYEKMRSNHCSNWRFRFYEVFNFWHLVTSNHFSPPPK